MQRRRFITTMAVVAPALSLTGCAALRGILPVISEIIRYADASAETLDKIDEIVNTWFALHPDEEAQKKYAKAMGVARNALRVVLKASEAAEEAANEDVEAASAKFEEAFTALLTVLQDLGFGITAGGDALSMSKDGKPTVEVPPLATMKLELSK